VSKLVKRRAGAPTGRVCCVLELPSLDLREDRYFYPAGQMSKLRRFIRNWVPSAEAAQEGGKFTVSAEVRHRDNQGYRRVILCRWRAGESIDAALEAAATKWKALTRNQEE
jgi:hypothetical protein